MNSGRRCASGLKRLEVKPGRDFNEVTQLAGGQRMALQQLLP